MRVTREEHERFRLLAKSRGLGMGAAGRIALLTEMECADDVGQVEARR